MSYTESAITIERSETDRPASSFHDVGYYSCDTAGTPIEDYGSASYLPSTDDDGQNTDIRRIAYELAWYLWDNFGVDRTPVDLVGHSMGGIVIAYALQRIAASDPGFPPSLIVHSVTTFSSPFDGVPSSACAPGSSLECSQLTSGSSLLEQIDDIGAVNVGYDTDWTLIGSDGEDLIPTASSLALPDATTRVDYTSPEYTHTSYLTDGSTAETASGTINGAPFDDGKRSLVLLASLTG